MGCVGLVADLVLLHVLELEAERLQAPPTAPQEVENDPADQLPVPHLKYYTELEVRPGRFGKTDNYHSNFKRPGQVKYGQNR